MRRQRHLPALRAGMSEEALRATWNGAHPMGFDEAIQLARAGIRDLS
jgi:hypothetical protein